MALTKIAGGSDGSGNCKNGDCPTVYMTDEHTDLIVQGYEIAEESTMTELNMPNGESAVRIPRDVILQAAARISEGE